MDQLWSRIKALHGQTLQTVRGNPFQLVSVDPEKVTAVTILVKSSGNRRNVLRQEIESSYQLGLKGDELTPLSLREGGASNRNPAYVAAILKAIGANKVGG